MGNEMVQEQPAPVPNDNPPTWGLVIADAKAMFRTWEDPSHASLKVIADMEARDAEGRRKYGVPLQAGNGRDSLVDAYQEILDACVYLRNAMEDFEASVLERDAYDHCLRMARRVRRIILNRDGK